MMNKYTPILLFLLLLASPPMAEAWYRGGGYFRGYGGYWGPGRYYGGPGIGFYFGPGFGWPYYPAYPFPAYPPVVVIPPSTPPVYIQQNSNQGQGNYWYFCPNANAYYPYVKDCPGGWRLVDPQPPH